MKKFISIVLTLSMLVSLVVFSTSVSAAANVATVSFAGTTTVYSYKGENGKLAGKFEYVNKIVDEDGGPDIEQTVTGTLADYEGKIDYEIENPSVIASIGEGGSFVTAGYGYTAVTAKVYDNDNILKAEGSVIITVFDSFKDGKDNETNVKAVPWKDAETGNENWSTGDPEKQFTNTGKDKAVSLMLDDGILYATGSNLSSWHTQNADPEDENRTVMSPTHPNNSSAFWFYGSQVSAWNPAYLGWQSKERVTNIWFYDDMTSLANPFMSFTQNEGDRTQGIRFGYNGDAYSIISSQNYAAASLGDSNCERITDVKRSRGWHQVVLVTENAKFLDPEKNVHAKFYIDGQLVLETDIYTELCYNMMINAIALKTTSKTETVTEQVQTGTDENGNPVYTEQSTSVTTYHTYYDEIYSVELNKSVEIRTMPENGAIDVPVETKFEIDFGREIKNQDAITVTCDGAAVTPVISQKAGKVTVDCGILEKDADYVITVGDTVEFADGTEMPENLVFSYKTAADASITELMGRKYEVLGSKYISFADDTKSVEDYGMNYVFNYDGFESKIENGAAVLTKKALLTDGSTQTANTKENYMMLNYLNSIDPQTADGQPKSGVIDRYVIKYKAKLGDIPQSELKYTRPIFNLFAADENVYHTAYMYADRMDYFNMFSSNVVGEGDNQRLRTSAASTVDLVNVNDMINNWVEVCYVVDINNWEFGNNATVTVSVNDGPESTEAVNTSKYMNNTTVGIEKIGRIGMYFLDGTRTADAEMSVKDFEIYALQKKYDYNNLTVKAADSEGDLTADDIAAGNTTANISLDVLNNNDLIPEQEFTATVVIYSGNEMKFVKAAKAEKTVSVGNYDTITIENLEIPQPGEDEAYTMSIFVWDNYDNLVPLIDKIEF